MNYTLLVIGLGMIMAGLWYFLFGPSNQPDPQRRNAYASATVIIGVIVFILSFIAKSLVLTAS